MARFKGRRMEAFFGFFGALFLLIILPITVFFTPGYTPLVHTVSTLGDGQAKSLFSIGFVVAGSLLIPFYIYLEREMTHIKEVIRRFATGIAIVTNVCIALVGIIPDETYITAFIIFHSIVAGVSFLGSSIYIVLYSYLMYQGPQSKLYKGPTFKKYLAYYGFSIGGVLILFFITWLSIVEWILTILMIIWVLITALQCISYKFFNIPGIYYKRAQYPEALKRFEDAIQVLDNLKMGEEPIMDTLKENIEFIKRELTKQPQK
ncbi:MAG: DUF998 domain-containing protein [Promethearchaeota archaeon]|nr:MAG: DUF998 domain-containing protein [Candidatus Lokiarchaeota archaeon]